MRKLLQKALVFILIMPLLSNCARDLSSNVYTSDATQSFTLEGTVVSARKVVVKNADQLSGNSTGTLAGGAMGAAIGSTAGDRRNASATAIGIVGGAIVGGVAGAMAEGKLGKANGYEYIVRVDRSKIKGDQHYDGSLAMRNAIASAAATGLITVVQGTDVVFGPGQKVYMIISDKRTRIIAAS